MTKVGWESPSNIAIIKYWGKHGRQLPNNPSVSFTLNAAATRTFVAWSDENKYGRIDLTFTFENKENLAFAARIEKFLDNIADEYFPFLKEISLNIESSNSFPHSSGIASSASGMSALAMCLCEIEQSITGYKTAPNEFIQKASIVARLGSGSACRSVHPEMGLWGFHPDIASSSDDFAIGISHLIHPVFKTFHDDILIISANEKSVSSTAGHKLMVGNPYANARYQQANQQIISLMEALKVGDIITFGKIAESEALTLHALMMSSDPYYILMEEASLTIIRKIKNFRLDTGIPIFFTLDAGPNIHVLYPDEYAGEVRSFILSELIVHCFEGRVIYDQIGLGPKKIL
ncbi:MAG: diphosphomevalonate decarboxylase [Saprospiraceae bacterium]|nr:diphosphomevalonate decarboxylase [Saprospiraceae bacterium]